MEIGFRTKPIPELGLEFRQSCMSPDKAGLPTVDCRYVAMMLAGQKTKAGGR